MRVDDRDREGSTIPLRPLPAQAGFLDEYQKIRSFNMAKQLVPGNPIFDSPAKYGLTSLPSDLRERFELILALGPDLVLETTNACWIEEHIIEVEPPPMPLHDGPVQIDVLKCRRGGISSIIQAILTLRAQFKKTRIFTVAQKGLNAELVHGLMKKYWQAWPEEYLDLRSHSKRLGVISKFENGSEARCFTAGGKESARADQADNLHGSEVAFFPEWDEIKAAFSGAPKHAHIFLESTANGESGGFYSHYQATLPFETVLEATCRQAPEDAITLARWNGFYRFFFSWLQEPAYQLQMYPFEREHLLNTLDDIERKLVAVHGATPEQLQWRRNRIKQAGEDENAAKSGLSPIQWFQQEFPADEKEAFQSTGARVFGQGGLDRCEMEAAGRADPEYLQILPDRPIVRMRREIATVSLFARPKKGHLYSLGVDLSKGLSSGDWSVFTILDRLDGTRAEQAAIWRGRHAPEALADTIAMLGDWYNEAFIVPELEGPAMSTISRLVRDLGYTNVYHRTSTDRISETGSSSGTWQYGWFPHPQAKWFAIYDLANALESGKLSVWDPQTLAELRIYQNIDRKLGAKAGSHDDTVTALSLAWLGCSPHNNMPVDPAAVAAADSATGIVVKSKDAEIWEYLKKLEERELKVLNKNPFFRKYGYLPE